MSRGLTPAPNLYSFEDTNGEGRRPKPYFFFTFPRRTYWNMSGYRQTHHRPRPTTTPPADLSPHPRHGRHRRSTSNTATPSAAEPDHHKPTSRPHPENWSFRDLVRLLLFNLYCISIYYKIFVFSLIPRFREKVLFFMARFREKVLFFPLTCRGRSSGQNRQRGGLFGVFKF